MLRSIISIALFTCGVAAACANGASSEGESNGTCDDLSGFIARCPAKKTECDEAFAKDCAKLATVLNAAIPTGAHACLNDSACGANASSCFARALDHASPTEAQKHLAAQYCTTCATTKGSDCETKFLEENKQLVLPFADAVAAEIEAKCLSGASCEADFAKCASGVIKEKVASTLNANTVECLGEGVIDPGTPSDAGVDASDAAPETSVVDSAPPADTGPMCGSDEAPNSPATVPLLKSITDCDGSGASLGGTLQTRDDIDYFRFHGSDTSLCRTGAFASTKDPVRLCIFGRCTDGSYPSLGCTKGTASTAEGHSMCCVEAGGDVEADFNCPGTSDDADVFIRVSGDKACRDYSVSFHY